MAEKSCTECQYVQRRQAGPYLWDYEKCRLGQRDFPDSAEHCPSYAPAVWHDDPELTVKPHTDHCMKRQKWGDGECECSAG
ncbi:MAG: hypothetical protein H6974_13070 [Gammaproteobacteria bacterium]|nr:hypothetical protein [Gammaproteobacteria bacterium]MCP5197696.1 hypothetical protein [Gammaproteobacteria bacterium]